MQKLDLMFLGKVALVEIKKGLNFTPALVDSFKVNNSTVLDITMQLDSAKWEDPEKELIIPACLAITEKINKNWKECKFFKLVSDTLPLENYAVVNLGDELSLRLAQTYCIKDGELLTLQIGVTNGN